MPSAHGYVRTSTFDQENGLQVQAEQVESFYRQTLFPKYPGLAWGGTANEPGVSGGKPFTLRKVGAELDKLLQEGDHLIVSKLDRGFRDTLDFLTMERAWKERGIVLHVLDLPFLGPDLPDYLADFIRTAMAMVAQFERGRIRTRTREVKAWLKKHGRPTNGHAGYGFQFVGPAGNKKRVRHDREREVMGWILQQHLTGKTWHSIWLELLQQGERTKEGNEWSIMRIIRACRAELLLRAQEMGNGHTGG
jgi:DNA invertase Pin-like site-specific DNA recombinase